MDSLLLVRLQALDHFQVLIGEDDLGEVEYLDQAESLVRTVETQAQAIGRELYDDGLL